MKKSSNILGSIALSAALVMGTAVPAFAAVGTEAAPTDMGAAEPTKTDTTATNEMQLLTEGNETTTGAKDGASTIVKASTYTSQLNVTIPLSVPLKFDTVGGVGLAPSDNAYYIENNSSTDIKVMKADFAVTDTDNWALAAGACSDAAPGDPSGNVAVGDFYLKIAPTATPKVSTESLTALELKAGSSKVSGTSTLNWGIASHQNFGFKLEPSSTKLKKSVNEAAKMAAITYTVGVGTDGAVMSEFTPQTQDPTEPITSMSDALSRPSSTGTVIQNFFADTTGTPEIVNGSGATVTLAADHIYKIDNVQWQFNGSGWMNNNGADKNTSFSYKVTVTDLGEYTPAA